MRGGDEAGGRGGSKAQRGGRRGGVLGGARKSRSTQGTDTELPGTESWLAFNCVPHLYDSKCNLENHFLVFPSEEGGTCIPIGNCFSLGVSD